MGRTITIKNPSTALVRALRGGARALDVSTCALPFPLNVERSDTGAIFSPCGLHRYLLWRHWVRTFAPVTFIMLNPSTADAAVNDRTVVRCIDYARRFGYGGIRVVNLFGFRSTDPVDLRLVGDPVGPLNDLYLNWALVSARNWGTVIAAWGPAPKARRLARDRAFAAVEMARGLGVPLHCLGRSKDGSPRHPLMLPKTALLEPFGVESAP